MGGRCVLAGCLAVGFAAGCATVFRGTRQRVEFRSSRPGVRVNVGGEQLTTPATIALRRNQHHVYRVTASGCAETSGIIQSQTCAEPPTWCVLDVVGAAFGIGLPGLGIDIATGALADLVPGTVHVAASRCAEGIPP
jgi:hypothetical protein